MSADLLTRLVDHCARPSGLRLAGEVRALLEELATAGAPPGGETLARQLVFDHLDIVQDQLPSAAAAKLEALLEPMGRPLAVAVPRPALDARVLDAVRREVPAPPRPPPPPRVAPWLGLAQLGAALGLTCIVALGFYEARQPVTVHGLISPLSPSAAASPIPQGALEVRLDRGANAIYRPGENIFIQLACAHAGHVSLLACRADGKPGVALADQTVSAGQVVVAHLAIGEFPGRASVIGVLSSDRLPGLVERMEHLPRPCNASTIMKSIDELAQALGIRVTYGTATLSIAKDGR